MCVPSLILIAHLLLLQTSFFFLCIHIKLAAILATGFRKSKENKKKVVAKVVDFPDFDNQHLGNHKSDSNDFFFSVPESVD